jgi:hypothetical protein
VYCIQDVNKYTNYLDSIENAFRDWYCPENEREEFEMNVQMDALFESCKIVIEKHGAMMHWDNNMFFILLYKYDDTNPTRRSNFAHEVAHAAFEMLRRAGLKETSESTEAYTYLIGHITEQLYIGITEQNKQENGTDIRRKTGKNKVQPKRGRQSGKGKKHLCITD